MGKNGAMNYKITISVPWGDSVAEDVIQRTWVTGREEVKLVLEKKLPPCWLTFMLPEYAV